MRRRWRARFGYGTAATLTLLWLFSLALHLNPADAVGRPLAGPSAAHLLDTDPLGRDVLLRMIESVEAFYGPGLFACAVAVLLGVPAGAVAGYWPRSVAAQVVGAVFSVIDAWPRLVLVIVAVSIFTASLHDPAAWASARLYLLGGLMGFAFLPQLGAAVRQRVASFHAESFVEAARAHGVSDWRILAVHILWANGRAVVLRQVCTLFGAFLLVETSLSYLGDYGVPPPWPSWGSILADVRSQVIHVRSLVRPEAWTPGELIAGLERAVHEGALLALIAPALAIVVSIAGLLALAEHLGQEDA